MSNIILDNTDIIISNPENIISLSILIQGKGKILNLNECKNIKDLNITVCTTEDQGTYIPLLITPNIIFDWISLRDTKVKVDLSKVNVKKIVLWKSDKEEMNVVLPSHHLDILRIKGRDIKLSEVVSCTDLTVFTYSKDIVYDFSKWDIDYFTIKESTNPKMKGKINIKLPPISVITCPFYHLDGIQVDDLDIKYLDLRSDFDKIVTVDKELCEKIESRFKNLNTLKCDMITHVPKSIEGLCCNRIKWNQVPDHIKYLVVYNQDSFDNFEGLPDNLETLHVKGGNYKVESTDGLPINIKVVELINNQSNGFYMEDKYKKTQIKSIQSNGCVFNHGGEN